MFHQKLHLNSEGDHKKARANAAQKNDEFLPFQMFFVNKIIQNSKGGSKLEVLTFENVTIY